MTKRENIDLTQENTGDNRTQVNLEKSDGNSRSHLLDARVNAVLSGEYVHLFQLPGLSVFKCHLSLETHSLLLRRSSFGFQLSTSCPDSLCRW